MLYVCQLLCDKGAELPRWQQAFGHRYTGTLVKKPIKAEETARWVLTATFSPLPFAEQQDHWPKPLISITELNEDPEARYIEGVEINRAVNAERYLRQVWKLTLVAPAELAEIQAKLSRLVVGDPNGAPPLYK